MIKNMRHFLDSQKNSNNLYKLTFKFNVLGGRQT